MAKTINILTIDGGGIRGVLPAEVLRYVEEKLQELTNSNIKIAEYFDLIVGTSTGGILTCIYTCPDKNGNPKYTAKDALDLYLNHGGNIFKKNFGHRIKTLFGLIGSLRYSGKNFEKLLDQYFGENTIKDATTPIMLTSVNTRNNNLYLFKSYKALSDPKHNFTFKESARSTSAAPTYFPSSKVMLGLEEMSLIDGGMAINNPSVSGYIEAKKIFPKSTKVNLLSVGTGRRIDSYSYKKTKKWGIIQWILKLFGLILTASAKGIEYQADKLYQTDLKGHYLRVEPILRDSVDEEMDKASKENLEELRLSGIETVELYKDRIDQFLIKTMEK